MHVYIFKFIQYEQYVTLKCTKKKVITQFLKSLDFFKTKLNLKHNGHTSVSTIQKCCCTPARIHLKKIFFQNFHCATMCVSQLSKAVATGCTRF